MSSKTKQANPDAVALAAATADAAANGTNVETLATSQSNLAETTGDPVIQPSQIAGVSNDPSLSNEQLTAKVAMLENAVLDAQRRIDNLSILIGGGAN